MGSSRACSAVAPPAPSGAARTSSRAWAHWPARREVVPRDSAAPRARCLLRRPAAVDRARPGRRGAVRDAGAARAPEAAHRRPRPPAPRAPAREPADRGPRLHRLRGGSAGSEATSRRSWRSAWSRRSSTPTPARSSPGTRTSSSSARSTGRSRGATAPGVCPRSSSPARARATSRPRWSGATTPSSRRRASCASATRAVRSRSRSSSARWASCSAASRGTRRVVLSGGQGHGDVGDGHREGGVVALAQVGRRRCPSSTSLAVWPAAKW